MRRSQNPASPGRFRYVLIDAYQRLGDPFVEKIADCLTAQKPARQKINGRAVLAQISAELSGLPSEAFAQRATLTQEANLARPKLTRPIPARSDGARSRARVAPRTVRLPAREPETPRGRFVRTARRGAQLSLPIRAAASAGFLLALGGVDAFSRRRPSPSRASASFQSSGRPLATSSRKRTSPI